MNNSLVQILIKAKEMNKWVPVKYLVKYNIQDVDLFKLEDKGLILVAKSTSEGLLLKLSLKGYHFYNK